MGMIWTDEKKAQLKQLLEVEGLSCVKVAKIFGVSKNAIVGAAHRNGIMFQGTNNIKPKWTPAPLPVPTYDDMPENVRRVFLLTKTQCRAIGCSGEQVPGYSYCKMHCKLFFQNWKEQEPA